MAEGVTLGEGVLEGVALAVDIVVIETLAQPDCVPTDAKEGAGGGNAEFEGDSDALGQGDDETVPLQISVDVAAFENGSDFVVVGVLMSGAQKGPRLALERCVPSMEKNGERVPNVVIVRVPVRKGVPDRARDGKPDTDRERDGETVLLPREDCDADREGVIDVLIDDVPLKLAALNVARCVPSIE